MDMNTSVRFKTFFVFFSARESKLQYVLKREENRPDCQVKVRMWEWWECWGWWRWCALVRTDRVAGLLGLLLLLNHPVSAVFIPRRLGCKKSRIIDKFGEHSPLGWRS
jgi:hypothetical protein